MTRTQLTAITWLLLILLIACAMLTAEAASITDAPISRYEYIGKYTTTGYVPELVGRGDGIGANGVRIIPSKHVAMCGIAFGTTVWVAGIGWRTVQDRGCARGVVDVACRTVSECYQITAHGVPVWIKK